MLHSALRSASSQGGIPLTVANCMKYWEVNSVTVPAPTVLLKEWYLQLEDQGGTCLTLILIYHQSYCVNIK